MHIVEELRKMSVNKNVEFVVNLDRNIDDLLHEYKKCCSTFTLLPTIYKINYVVIYIMVVIAILSCAVITKMILLGLIFFAIAVAGFLYTNIVHVKYLNKRQNEMNIKRYQYLSNKLNDYSPFALNCLIERIQVNREKHGNNITSLIITTFAVIALPIWESYVSIFFEKNIVETELDSQIKNFFVIALCAMVLLFLCIGVYVLAYTINDIFCKDRFYNNLNNIIKTIIDVKGGSGSGE